MQANLFKLYINYWFCLESCLRHRCWKLLFCHHLDDPTKVVVIIRELCQFRWIALRTLLKTIKSLNVTSLKFVFALTWFLGHIGRLFWRKLAINLRLQISNHLTFLKLLSLTSIQETKFSFHWSTSCKAVLPGERRLWSDFSIGVPRARPWFLEKEV